MFRSCAIVCTVVACGLAAWAGYTALHETGLPEEAGLVVENPERVFGELTVGEHLVMITVTNQSDQPADIVGYLGGCGSGCCVRARDKDRRSAAPGETVELVGVLEVRSAGPFEFEDELFLSDKGGTRSVRVKLTGVGVTGGKPNATPP